MNLHRRIAAIIITRLELEGYAPENFPLATPLFGPKPGGFGLDSLAGLEIMSGLSDEFGEPFDDVQRTDLESVAALAAYVRRKAPNALAAAKGHE